MIFNPNHNAGSPAYRQGMVGRARTPAPLFGQRLASLRKERGLTQVQLAKKLGVSDKLVEYYERRAKNPSLDLVKKLADFFEVSPVYFTADELPTKRRPGPQGRFQKRLAEIEKLPPKQQEVVLLFLDSFLERAKKKAS